MAQSIKESMILEFISKINLSEKNLSLNQIEMDLIKICGERPSVQPTWKKDVLLTENNKKAVEIKRLDSISIFFTDLDDKIKKIDIKI